MHPIQEMDFREHAHLTGSALKHWLVAQLQDSAAVAGLWLVGLLIIQVPWAPLWAVLAALFQFIPHLGPVMALAGPAVAAVATGGFMRLIYVFILYAVVAIVDGLVLQPYLMKRTAKVPIWASILAPIVLGMIFSFWGVLLAAPLLAVLYAYRARHKESAGLARPDSRQSVPGPEVPQRIGEGAVLPPEEKPRLSTTNPSTGTDTGRTR